jgi:predicted transposase YbfD/YdcC
VGRAGGDGRHHHGISAGCGELSLAGALVTHRRHGLQAIAQSVRDAGADYVLAVKANQSGLLGEIERFFADAPLRTLDCFADADKGHGRVEERTVAVSQDIGWLDGGRRFPGEYRFPDIAALARVETRVFEKGTTRTQRRFFVASRGVSAKDFAQVIRDHWAIENSLHWVLDVVFHEDKARSRTGHGPRNMAVVRHFALNLVRTADDKRSIKLRRKKAGRNNDYLAKILQPSLN